MNKLSQNVKTLRLSRGLSQEQLGGLSGVNRSTISMIENGTANPTLNGVLDLAGALGVSIEELLSSSLGDETRLFTEAELKKEKFGDGLALKIDLLPRPIPGIQFEKLLLRPHAGIKGIPHLKGTSEFFTCITGEITINVEGDEHVLNPGCVLSFAGHKRHSYRNTTDMKASGISAVVLEGRGK